MFSASVHTESGTVRCVHHLETCMTAVCPSQGPDPLSGTVGRQTGLDLTIGQWVVSDRNLACAVLNRHKNLSDGEVCLSVPIATGCFVPLSWGGVASSSRARILGECSTVHSPPELFFKVEICSRTLISLFSPVHSGSASGDDCDRMFPASCL